MIPTLYALPYDPNGNLEGNYQTEIIDLDEQYVEDNKVVVLTKGYFYKHDLIITYQDGTPLGKHQYRVTSGHPKLTADTSLENASVLVIQGELKHSTIVVTARMVGGEYCSLNHTIVTELKNLMQNTRVVHYNNIKGVPNDFKVSGHLHALWQLYGFTESTLKLKRIEACFELEAQRDFDELWREIKLRFDETNRDLGDVELLLTEHIANKNNPHRLTAKQVGLDAVLNAPIATDAEASFKSGDLLATYATPRSLDLAIKTNFLNELDFHINNTNNPHRENANDIGTYNTGQLDYLNSEYYNRGETTRATHRISGTKDADNNTLSIGETFQELYDRARKNLNASEIRTGTIPIENIIAGGKPANHILVAGPNNNLVWRSVAEIWTNVAPKPFSVFRVATDAPNGGTAGWLNANFPPHTVGEGSIALFKQTNMGTSYQNGTHRTYFTSFGMATMRQGSWRE